jgi:hypothetical protein
MGQDVYRGTLDEPMSLHRLGYVGNNPVNYYDYYGYFGWKDIGNAALIPIDFLGGVASAFEAGIQFGSGNIVAGTSLTMSAFSGINDVSKKLNSVMWNASVSLNLDRLIAGKDFEEKTPDEMEGIFSQFIEKNPYIDGAMKTNDFVNGLVGLKSILSNVSDIYSGGNKFVSSVRKNGILSSLSMRIRTSEDSFLQIWQLLNKGELSTKKYRLPKSYIFFPAKIYDFSSSIKDFLESIDSIHLQQCKPDNDIPMLLPEYTPPNYV